jgi:pimeloyl-ACP methyl ester carboxylesterase
MANTGTAKINGFEMDYFYFGDGEKKFVILPGLGIQSIMKVAKAVEESYGGSFREFTIYVFDRRKSIPEDYSIYDMADDTAAVMKELGLEDVYLFGASQGGMIALVMAIRYPELVKKLALGSTSPRVHDEQIAVIDEWIELAEKRDSHALYQAYGKEIYPPAVYEQFKDFFDEVAKSVTDEEMEKFVILAKAIRNYNVTDDLKKINCPVLALGVFEDPVLDSDATMEIAENLDYRSDFELYMYIGFGHAAFDTAPDYRQRVYDFFMKE